jgi:hypothetical protein
MSKRHVNITSDKGGVDVDGPTVSIVNRDEVIWHSFDNQEATVRFKSGPFVANEFVVPAGGSVCTGPPRANAGEQSYKYDVVGSGGTTDPTIIIQR